MSTKIEKTQENLQKIEDIQGSWQEHGGAPSLRVFFNEDLESFTVELSEKEKYSEIIAKVVKDLGKAFSIEVDSKVLSRVGYVDCVKNVRFKIYQPEKREG